jgi:hypothetical protein
MAREAAHLIRRFSGYAATERLVTRHESACKLEFLPDEDSELIARVVEVVALEDAAAPKSDLTTVQRDRERR